MASTNVSTAIIPFTIKDVMTIQFVGSLAFSNVEYGLLIPPVLSDVCVIPNYTALRLITEPVAIAVG